jgi:hypothetical protein
MKHLRALLLFLPVVAILGLAAYWAARNREGFATPLDCLEAYRDACLAGDGRAQLRCMGDELLAEKKREFPDLEALGKSSRESMQDLKSWTARGPASSSDGREAVVGVEETRPAGKRLVRFRLRLSDRGWIISAIESPQALPAGIPYGTHVSKVTE